MTNISKVSASLAEAFIDDPFYRAITVEAKNDLVRKLLLTRYFEIAINEAERVGEVKYAGSDGAALWLTNEHDRSIITSANDVRKKALAQELGVEGFENYLMICSGMSQCVPQELENAWYLSILGVRSEARGRGIAQTLLSPTLQRADDLGITCYLETFNPLSLPFYYRLGFGNAMRFLEPFTSREYWLLTRHP